jgi:hypothetical protein
MSSLDQVERQAIGTRLQTIARVRDRRATGAARRHSLERRLDSREALAPQAVGETILRDRLSCCRQKLAAAWPTPPKSRAEHARSVVERHLPERVIEIVMLLLDGVDRKPVASAIQSGQARRRGSLESTARMISSTHPSRTAHSCHALIGMSQVRLGVDTASCTAPTASRAAGIELCRAR